MQSVATSLTVVNETDVRGLALANLISQYITFKTHYYGFRNLGVSPHINFPVLMVEPKSARAVMIGTAKFDVFWTYAIYWYVRDAKSEDCVTQSTFIAEALVKLLSNNALGDIGSANPPSNKFFQYANPGGGYYWLKAEIKSIDWSVNYLDPEVAPNMRYERSGRMMLELYDLILK